MIASHRSFCFGPDRNPFEITLALQQQSCQIVIDLRIRPRLTQKSRQNLPETIGIASFRRVGSDAYPVADSVDEVCFPVTPIGGAKTPSRTSIASKSISLLTLQSRRTALAHLPQRSARYASVCSSAKHTDNILLIVFRTARPQDPQEHKRAGSERSG